MNMTSRAVAGVILAALTTTPALVRSQGAQTLTPDIDPSRASTSVVPFAWSALWCMLLAER